jgi:hypothetical protein
MLLLLYFYEESFRLHFSILNKILFICLEFQIPSSENLMDAVILFCAYIMIRAFNTGIYFQNRFFGIQKFQNRDPGFKTGFEIFDE